MQIHRENHYLAQLYLKQWVREGKVSCYRFLVRHEDVHRWKSHSPGGIAFRRNLYTRLVGSSESDDLERWFGREFESPAAHALTRAVSDQKLDSEDWRALIRFAFVHDVRTPARLRQFLKRQQVELERTLRSSVGRIASGESHEKGGRVGGAKFDARSLGGDFPLRVSVLDDGEGGALLKAETIVGRSLWHWSLRVLLQSTINKIPLKGWTILKAAQGVRWPTSDAPVIRVGQRHDGAAEFDGGWGSVGTQIWMPLSPTRMLYHEVGAKKPASNQLNFIESNELVELIVQHADSYVFSDVPFDIERIRRRVVDPHLCDLEDRNWREWGNSQLEIERRFQSAPPKSGCV